MATLLETYYAGKASFDRGLQTAKPDQTSVWLQQEILYRIEVLEACQMFVKSAPRIANVKELHWHYQMVDAYFQGLTSERRYSVGTLETAIKQRDTAHHNLLVVIQDYQKSFGSFNPGNDAGYYAKAITKVIQTVLATWIQYRQVFTEIEEAA